MQVDVDDVLEHAAKLVETPGFWTQGAVARDEHGLNMPAFIDSRYVTRTVAGISVPEKVHSVCALGAIETAVVGLFGAVENSVRDAAIQALGRVIHHDEYPTSRSEIAGWNDREGQTADDVAEKMKDAAREWRIKCGKP